MAPSRTVVYPIQNKQTPTLLVASSVPLAMEYNSCLGRNQQTDDELASEFLAFQKALAGEEKDSKSVGRHFTFMESVWGGDEDDDDDAYVEINASDFDAIKRTHERAGAALEDML